MQTDTPTRSQRFAKLLDYQGSQALVFLQRDDTDKLIVIVQLWSRSADAQIRAAIDVEFDDQAQHIFETFDDAMLADFVSSSGVGDAL